MASLNFGKMFKKFIYGKTQKSKPVKRPGTPARIDCLGKKEKGSEC